MIMVRLVQARDVTLSTSIQFPFCQKSGSRSGNGETSGCFPSSGSVL